MEAVSKKEKLSFGEVEVNISERGALDLVLTCGKATLNFAPITDYSRKEFIKFLRWHAEGYVGVMASLRLLSDESEEVGESVFNIEIYKVEGKYSCLIKCGLMEVELTANKKDLIRMEKMLTAD